MVSYCDLDDVKAVLQIEAAETKYDAQLAECVTSGSALVDGFLKPHGLSVPALVPQLIKDLTKFFAAWMFRRFSDPVGAEAFWTEADRFLKIYVYAEVSDHVGTV